MSQISPPIRILVIAVLGLVTAYMLILRPKEEPIAASPTPAGNVQTGEPAVTGAGKIAEAAKKAAEASNAKSQQTEETAGADDATGTAPAAKAAPGAKAPAAVTTTKEGVSLKGLPRPVVKALAADKVLVLLFWNKDSADDRAVRQDLRDVDKWDGGVRVQAAPLKKVSKYGRITRGADVSQTPTTLVVDRNLKVTSLVGYVDTKTIDQAVLDAMRNSGGYLDDPYLAKINQVCNHAGRAVFAVARPNSPAKVGTWVRTNKRIVASTSASFAAVKAPKRWRGFKAATVRDHKAISSYYAAWAAYLGTSPSAARVVSGINKFSGREAQFGRTANRYNNRMDDHHVLACGSNA